MQTLSAVCRCYRLRSITIFGVLEAFCTSFDAQAQSIETRRFCLESLKTGVILKI